MTKFPLESEIIEQYKKELGIKNLAFATIRQIVGLANKLEQKYETKFIRTEMGVPGLPAHKIGVEAEINALNQGLANIYPPIEGIPELKNELSRFAKLFLNIDINPQGCIPSVGAMQASFVLFMVTNRRDEKKRKTLFIDPGFPVQKRQVAVLGMEYESFDIYDYRGEKLREKLESYLKNGDISTFLYSNPNNPSWVCFTPKELQIIGELATKYDVIVLEDLAYFGMDFRKNIENPGKPPYQETVANYTDNYVLMVSASKIFSYAGQRIGSVLISDKLYNRQFPYLNKIFTSDTFGHTLIQEALYTSTAGTSHTAQVAFMSLIKAVNDGKFSFVSNLYEYGERAKVMKSLFVENGFNIVYDKDENQELADGFYFTISYPEMSGEELLNNLLKFGISAITLDTTGSKRTEGLRVCVSQTDKSKFGTLENRLKAFSNHFNKNK